MLFGLFNASITFQGYINKILAEKLNIIIIAYLDDILIYTEDPSQLHIEVVGWVLDQFWKYLLFVNLKKYQFYQNKVYFLEYIVSFKDIRIETKNIEVIKKWPKLKLVRDI